MDVKNVRPKPSLYQELSKYQFSAYCFLFTWRFNVLRQWLSVLSHDPITFLKISKDLKELFVFVVLSINIYIRLEIKIENCCKYLFSSTEKTTVISPLHLKIGEKSGIVLYFCISL